MSVLKCKTMFFIGHMNYIGGVEQWIYYIAQKYSNTFDITLVYKWGAPEQIKRLSKIINCVKYIDQTIECDVAHICYDLSLCDKIKAKDDFILTIHADYKVQNIRIEIPKQVTKIYCVSKTAQKSFIETHGDQLKKLKLTCKVLYNPIVITKPKRILKLISATRLTPEKGEKRMIQLAELLHENNIPFIWTVFTTSSNKSTIPGFIYMEPRLDILEFINDADYLVQLSDTEGFAYSIVESLALGTPVISTNIPVADEMGLKDGVNGYILNFEMDNVDVDKIYNNIPKFEYKCKESDAEWKLNLGKKYKSNYKYTETPIVNTKLNYRSRGFNSVEDAFDFVNTLSFSTLGETDKAEYINWLKK